MRDPSSGSTYNLDTKWVVSRYGVYTVYWGGTNVGSGLGPAHQLLSAASHIIVMSLKLLVVAMSFLSIEHTAHPIGRGSIQAYQLAGNLSFSILWCGETMTINHKFSMTGLLVKPNAQESDNILAKADWECVFWRGDSSVSGAGASYLTRKSKPDGVELAEITPDQAVEWMIASEGGQPFVDRLIKGHEWFILGQENRAQLQRLFGQELAQILP